MILRVKYQTGRMYTHNLGNNHGFLTLEEIAKKAADAISSDFFKYKKGLTEKSKSKYWISQYCMILQKLESIKC